MKTSINIQDSLLPFLPLLYIAWADGILEKHEIDYIKNQIDDNNTITDATKQLISKWLDPSHPPSARELVYWKKYIKQHADVLDLSEKQDLYSLGTVLAKKPNLEEWANEKTKQSLQQIENYLGVSSHEAIRFIDDFNPALFKVDSNLKRSEAPYSKALKTLLQHGNTDIKNKVQSILDPHKVEIESHNDDLFTRREKVLQWTQELADAGLGKLAYPSAYGGSDSMVQYASVFEEIAKYDLSLTIKFGVHFGLFGGSVESLGTNYHHDKYLIDIGTMALPGCFAMTEMHHGSNVKALQTTATYQPDDQSFIIHTPTQNDRKTYIGNAAMHAQMATVFAQLIVDEEEYGIHAFLVPIRNKQGETMPGITIGDNGHKMGLNGVDNGTLHFDKVTIPKENLLNKFGDVDEEGQYTSPISSSSRRFFTMLGTLVGGRLCVPIAGNTASKKALNMAVYFALDRKQFGPPGKEEQSIMDYPTHQKKLMPLIANAYAYDIAHEHLLREYTSDLNHDAQQMEALAAGLKSLSTWNATETIQTCREACGGKGYLSEMYFDRLKADTDIFTTFEGDNTVLLQLTAKSRLTYFKKQFGRMDWWDTLKYISNIASTNLSELNPLVTRDTSEDHLLENDFQLSAFTYREEYSLRSLAMRLNKKIKNGVDSYDAFLDTQVHLIDMASAYIDRIVLERFIAKIEEQENKSVKDILTSLKNLYALHRIEENKGWYLEHDYISGSKSLAINKLVQKLCKELKNESQYLVDAFDIPKHMTATALKFY
ncbi:acyl-CoA oxidase [Nonlabens arenilitoris]|uniref:acyl-CoA oxidase n=1 Tax=Nonlabens arenilitoris TaxID=1217969 RepID=A0A2S7UBB7_9FLAO|nr:acyl-CoA dehydrogenase [Nonlabens arenilitoris]PQJ32215.1 acyl-CoA oxidase [Nonlabens arenilitoris]